MKKNICFIYCICYVFLRQWQKTSFSEAALSETILTTDGSQLAFPRCLKKAWRKTLVIEICSVVWDCIKSNAKIKELQANNTDVDFIYFYGQNSWQMESKSKNINL
jgi:hypothetical protein